jgi:hypothetical protein
MAAAALKVPPGSFPRLPGTPTVQAAAIPSHCPATSPPALMPSAVQPAPASSLMV